MNVLQRAGALGVALLAAACGGPTDPSEAPPPAARFFFSAFDTVHGRELWTTDGTAEGTRLFRDVVPGAASSNPREVTRVGSRVYFVAASQLWMTEGTPETTRALGPSQGLDAMQLTVFRGRLFFVGDDHVHFPQIWQTDGTVAGTTMVAELPSRFPATYNALTAVDDRLLFFWRRARQNAWTREDDGLWRTDGTAAGTWRVVENAPYGRMRSFTALNGILYFAQEEDLYRSDGTVDGTWPFRFFRLRIDARAEPAIAAAGGELFFVVDVSELWKNDAATGESMTLSAMRDSGGIRRLAALGGKALVFAENGLYTSDGTREGIRRIASPGSPSLTRTAAGLLYFVVPGPGYRPSQYELWRTDGTAAGTLRLRTLVSSLAPELLLDAPDTGLLFTAGDAERFGLWRTDGRPEGTVLVRDLERK